MKKIKLLFVAAILMQINIVAQSFTASVDESTVGLNSQFQVSFTFSGNDINNIKNFTPPGFENFMVLSGPNQSTSMQIINGATSASVTYSYYLQPKSLGTYTIGSASIQFKGSSFSTQPIKIQVVKGSSSPQQSAQSQQDASVPNEEIAKNLFIRATVDKHKVYQGESVIVTYKLYTRVNIASQMSVTKLPQYQGFWAEELDESNNINFTTEVVDGKQFRVGVLKRVALFPSQSGDLSVTPLVLDVPVQVQRKRETGNNIMDDFFNDPFFNMGQTINYTAKSNTVKLKVIPLPVHNKPDSFSGAVGQFTLNSSLNEKNTKTNEPINLKINISGTGNIQLINVPEINLPNGFEKYEPKTTEQINRSGRISGRKTFEYLIIPRTVGTKKIPPVKFTYFDPQKKTYITLSTKSYTVNVEQGSSEPSGSIAGVSKEDVRLLGEDIRYIKTSTADLERKGDMPFYSFGFWTAAILPLFLLGGLVTWKRRDDKLAGNLQLLRYQKAEKVAKNRLKKAKELMKANNQNEFYSEVSLALFGYLEDKLHIPKAEFSLERAAEVLHSNNIAEDTILKLNKCAEKCEYFRFAPKNDGIAAMNDLYEQLSAAIIDVEKTFSGKKNV